MAGPPGVAPQVIRPGSPDLERVAVQVSEVVVSGPQDEHWHRQLPARGHVRLVRLAIDAQPGSVVLDHRVDGRRIVDRAAVVRVVLGAHPFRSFEYHASGSARIARSGLSGRPKKNQCGQACANRAFVRASASPIGTASSTTRWLTRAGWSSAVRSATYAPRSWPTTANRSWASADISPTASLAIARFDA